MKIKLLFSFLASLFALFMVPIKWVVARLREAIMPASITFGLLQLGRLLMVQYRRLQFSNLQRCATVFAVSIFVSMVAEYQAHAQPYFTNSASGSFFGAQQYNQAFPNPVQPSQTLARQYSAGINTFSLNSGIYTYQTNSFATNYTYSALPAVMVSQYGAASTLAQTNNVISITTTNCIIWFGGLTNVNYSIIAIGH